MEFIRVTASYLFGYLVVCCSPSFLLLALWLYCRRANRLTRTPIVVGWIILCLAIAAVSLLASRKGDMYFFGSAIRTTCILWLTGPFLIWSVRKSIKTRWALLACVGLPFVTMILLSIMGRMLSEININWLVLPTLAGAILLFVVGERSVRRCQTFRDKITLTLLWLVLGIPGFLLPMYYLHLFDDALWFYEFRSIPFTELTAMGAGLFAGALAELAKGSKVVSRPFLIVILVLGIVAPHMKPILAPVASHRFSDRWNDDVCIQSTPSSCGAASAATIFRSFGHSLSEQHIAKECFTYLGGTENWYITRAFRQRGYNVTYRLEKDLPKDLQTPAIAGVRIGGVGHFIAILENSGEIFVTGDPLVGRETLDGDEIDKRFDFTGFFMEIRKEG